jgi:hypothetical protein
LSRAKSYAGTVRAKLPDAVPSRCDTESIGMDSVSLGIDSVSQREGVGCGVWVEFVVDSVSTVGCGCQLWGVSLGAHSIVLCFSSRETPSPKGEKGKSS